MLSGNLDLQPQDCPAYWAYQILSEAISAGISKAVISPGSRSTPLTLAAAAHKHIQKQVVLDERSAGFTALGISKYTGLPALLICTSGSAVANYYPAVIEAAQSAVPMVILSADRPPYLQQTGANQTIDQQNLFGNYAHFFDSGLPDCSETNLAKIRERVKALFLAIIKERKVLHINCPFAKPLEPTLEFFQYLSALDKNRLSENNTSSIQQTTNPSDKSDFSVKIQQAIGTAKKPVVIAGQHQPFDKYPDKLINFAEKLNAPVLAEYGSQWLDKIHPDQMIAGFNVFLRSAGLREKLKPDLIIRTGDALVGKGILQYLQTHRNIPHFHFSTTDLPSDPSKSVTNGLNIRQHQFKWSDKIAAPNSEWLQRWQILSEAFRKMRDQCLSNLSFFTDLDIFGTLLPEIPSSYNFFIGNSLPVRDIEMMVNCPISSHKLFANRGASGIDGNLSTAAGISLASGQPTLVVTGDLTFLHDSNALLLLQQISHPFVIIVINNGGGAIFDMLPIAEHIELMEPYFRTPQNTEIKYLARANHISYQKINSKDELMKKWNAFKTISGPVILECFTHAAETIKIRKKLWNTPWHKYLN